MSEKVVITLFDLPALDEGLGVLDTVGLDKSSESERHTAELERIAKEAQRAEDLLIAATPEDAKLEAFDIGEACDTDTYKLRQAIKVRESQRDNDLAVLAATYTPKAATDPQRARVFAACKAVAMVAVKALRAERAKRIQAAKKAAAA